VELTERNAILTDGGRRAPRRRCARDHGVSALRHWHADPGKRVAIIGFGGLGHAGVQIVTTMGASTALITNMEQQMGDVLQMGASGFRTTKDLRTYDELASSFDPMISTVPASYELDIHLNPLAKDGTFVSLGVPQKPLSIEPYPVLTNRRSVAGSMSDGIPGTQDMVDFCAQQRIRAEDEIIEASYVDEAFDRLVASGVRCRPDIDASRLAGERSHESRPT
jgi:alcohol dehydrogenase (NADP+)